MENYKEIYIKNDNHNIVPIYGNIYSLRCRQRGTYMDGSKVSPLKFVSYKSQKKQLMKSQKDIFPMVIYDHFSKL